MQELISRFGGTPALILKLVFLGLMNGAAIWAIPALLTTQTWVMLGILVVSTVALDYFMLTQRFVPGKYVIIGTILLLVFQIVPIGYTVGIAFTNYSTGNVGTKEEAITAIERDTVAASEDSLAYDMVPVYNQTGELVLLLSPQTPIEDTTGTETVPTDEASARPETSAGGVRARTRRPRRRSSGRRTRVRAGGVRAEDTASRLRSSVRRTRRRQQPAFEDTATGSGAAGTCPVTYVGTTEGLEELPPSAVQRDEFGVVTGATDFETVPDAELPHASTPSWPTSRCPDRTAASSRRRASPRRSSSLPTLEYDAAASTFTSLSTGMVYVDNGEGSFANPDNPEDYLVPGWREFVGCRTSRASSPTSRSATPSSRSSSGRSSTPS